MANRKRGPYKRYLSEPDCKVPRQTLHNWRRRQDEAAAILDEANNEFDNSEGAEFTDSSQAVLDPPLAESGSIEQPNLQDNGSDPFSASSRLGSSDIDADPESSSGTDSDSSVDSSPAHQASPAHKLFNGAQVSDEMAVMLVLGLQSKHKLTQSALSDILSVLSMHLPSGQSIPTAYKSLYHLLKSISARESGLSCSTVVHRLCGKCEAYLPEGQQCLNPTVNSG